MEQGILVPSGKMAFTPLVNAVAKCDKLVLSFALHLEVCLISDRIFERILFRNTAVTKSECLVVYYAYQGYSLSHKNRIRVWK